MSKYEKVRQLGKGSFGNVFLVTTISSKQCLVLKEVNIRTLNEKEREQALTEIEILAKCKHLNVIKYKHAFVDSQTALLGIVMEFAESGISCTLYSHRLVLVYVIETQ